MIRRIKYLKFYIMFLSMPWFVSPLIGACLLRFQLAVAREHVRQMMALPIIVAAEVALFGKIGVYRGSARPHRV